LGIWTFKRPPHQRPRSLDDCAYLVHIRNMSPRGQLRERRFAFVVTDEERAKLDALAKADRRTSGDWLRVMIDREYAARFGAPRPKAKRGKR
jgi:hypothetical protein